jgi:hypothetical protein
MTHPHRACFPFWLAAAVFGCGGDDASPCADHCDDPTAPRIISASAQSVIESEAHLAALPDGTLAATWTSRTGPDWLDQGHIGYAFSDDDGDTWSAPAAIGFPDRDRQVNVKVAGSESGEMYLVWLGRSFSTAPDAIVVARAAAGGRTFEPPVEVTDPSAGLAYDLPAIATHRGVVIAAYNQQDPAAETECFANAIARSDDAGRTWSRVVASPCSPDEWLQNINALCAADTGDRIWLAYVIGTPDKLRVEVRSSDDGGYTWPDERTVRVSAPAETVAFDPMFCVADADGMSVAYGTTDDEIVPGVFGKLDAIKVARVSVAGEVTEVDALDPADGFALHPQIAGAGDDLHVLYLAGARDGDSAGSLRRIRVGDKQSEAVHAPIRFEQTWGVPGFLGDYFGAVVTGAGLGIAYPVQTGDSEVHIAFELLEP